MHRNQVLFESHCRKADFRASVTATLGQEKFVHVSDFDEYFGIYLVTIESFICSEIHHRY